MSGRGSAGLTERGQWGGVGGAVRVWGEAVRVHEVVCSVRGGRVEGRLYGESERARRVTLQYAAAAELEADPTHTPI